MKLHTETVSQTLISVLDTLMSSDVFSDFRLVGGTALSLQRGHRISIDIDLFTDLDYGQMNRSEIYQFISDRFPYHENIESLNQELLGHCLYVGQSRENSIKLDLFYTDKFLFPPIYADNWRLADQRDIAAMKILAITSGELRQKDFWDIHELLDDFTLSEMVKYALEMYPYTLTQSQIVESLMKIESVHDMSYSFKTIKQQYWDLIKIDILDAIEGLGN